MMKSKNSFCLLLCAPIVTAHYTFPWLYVNGTLPRMWQYVRYVAIGYEDGENWDSLPGPGMAIPQYDTTSTNFTCGRLAIDYAKTTETADVIAGTVVSFRVNQGFAPDDEGALNSGLNHPGPAQAYLAKPPEGVALEDFSGTDGDWFKIATLGAKTNESWVLESYAAGRMANITIPATTPPGTYLLRFEQFWRDNNRKWEQWFVNCAQVNIIGPGGGSLKGYPFAKFPGVYDEKDPGNLDHPEFWDKYGYYQNLLAWVAPGPPVWTGE
ncbi:unnamed protein product [Periconia digitata]|uniref:lytic cellulose monooxygenase (C4-dehydrogenating) n=1 Tax=Periconia digitata TaxID=1303443 RepID=A0A9W4UN08_9PLEO|nr:unnamed protein product [Periconia digitata]